MDAADILHVPKRWSPLAVHEPLLCVRDTDMFANYWGEWRLTQAVLAQAVRGPRREHGRPLCAMVAARDERDEAARMTGLEMPARG